MGQVPQLTLAKLSHDQVDAVYAIEQWYAQIQQPNNFLRNQVWPPFMLAGAAGTGKTSILPVVMQDLHINQADDVVGLSTSAMAAKNIGDKTNVIDVRTIASFLKVPWPEITIHTQSNYEVVYAWSQLVYWLHNRSGKVSKPMMKKIEQWIDDNMVLNGSASHNVDLDRVNLFELNQIFKRKQMFTIETVFINQTEPGIMKLIAKQIEGKRLLIVDEVSMIAKDDITQILKIARRSQVPVLLIGDPFQLLPVNASPCDYLLDMHYQYRITLLKLHRQSNQIAQLGAMLRPPKSLSIHQAITMLKYTTKKGLGAEIKVANAKSIQLAGKLGRFWPTLDAQDMVLTNTNRQVQTLTTGIRGYHNGWTLQQSKNSGIVVGDRLRIAVNELPKIYNVNLTRKQISPVSAMEKYMNGMLADVIEMMTDAQFYSKLGQIGASYAMLAKRVGLKCITLRFEDGRVRKNVIVNTVDIHNPKFSTSVLQSKPLLNLGIETKSLLSWYHDFEKNVLQDIKSPFCDTKYRHFNIVYVTFGQVLTVHKAQGREWKRVAFYRYGDAFSDTKRLDYTAITRAKEEITLLLDGPVV